MIRAAYASLLCFVVTCGLTPSSRAEVPKDAIRLIQKAGNAESDLARLETLRELSSLSGIDAELQRDTERLVKFVEKWVDSRKLAFFGGEVSRNADYDFRIADSSPLNPLVCFYRGRMLTWATLELGNIIRYEDRRRAFLDKAVANFRIAKSAFPENRIIRMYLGEPMRSDTTFASPTAAPDWCDGNEKTWERLTDIIEWWIDHRMQPNGEYGGGWGDDCEMWRWWTPVLVGFDDPKIGSAQARFSAALMQQSHMRLGYTTTMTDVEHTAEDSADAITPMMHLDPDNPSWTNRAQRLADFMERLWTGVNQRGQLQFKSTYFTAERVETRNERACDTVYHPRAMQPALLLWQRTGDSRLSALFTRWMDTWVDATARAERDKPAGIVPSAIHWPDGNVGGTGENWWDPQNHGEPTLYEWPSALTMMNDTMLLTYHMTGNEKYLQPLRSMAAIRRKYLTDRPSGDPVPGGVHWCGEKLSLLNSTLGKYRFLTGSNEFDDLLGKQSRGSVDSHRDDESVSQLRDSAGALSVNFPGYTSEVRWTDRVLRFPALFGENMMFRERVPTIQTPDPQLIYSMATGDPGSAVYFPLNAVRWRTPPREIAARVTSSSRHGVMAELFHFGDHPRTMSAELYLLDPGKYTLAISATNSHEDSSTKPERRSIEVVQHTHRVQFTLAPGVLTKLSIQATRDEQGTAMSPGISD